MWFKYKSSIIDGKGGRVSTIEVTWDELGEWDEYGSWEDVFIWGNQNSEEDHLMWLQVQFCQEYISED